MFKGIIFVEYDVTDDSSFLHMTEACAVTHPNKKSQMRNIKSQDYRN